VRSCPAPSEPGITAIALVLDASLDDHVGALEHVAPIAWFDRGRQVGAELLELQWRIGREGGLGVGDGGQRVVLDDHRFGRVGRRGAGLGDHDRHRVADEPHLRLGERRADALRVQLHQPLVRRQSEIVGGEDRDDARHRPSVVRVDRHQSRVRVRGTHEVKMQRAVDREVVDELRTTQQQIGIFDAPDRRSENRSGHAPTLSRDRSLGCAGSPPLGPRISVPAREPIAA